MHLTHANLYPVDDDSVTHTDKARLSMVSVVHYSSWSASAFSANQMSPADRRSHATATQHMSHCGACKIVLQFATQRISATQRIRLQFQSTAKMRSLSPPHCSVCFAISLGVSLATTPARVSHGFWASPESRDSQY